MTASLRGGTTLKTMKFNSQICTSREQSERLLALGLKKETADMFWWDNGYGSCAVISRPAEKEDGEYGKVIPAWSLHRLIEMISEEIQTDWQSMCLQDKGFTKRDDLYDNIVDCIEWLIKEGYFNKEYLENGK
jgi:hypothetical protein